MEKSISKTLTKEISKQLSKTLSKDAPAIAGKTAAELVTKTLIDKNQAALEVKKDIITTKVNEIAKAAEVPKTIDSQSAPTIPRIPLPLSIMNLTISEIITYALQALNDTYIDLMNLYKTNNITIASLIGIILQENRILHLGIGLLLISFTMFIFNNFIRLPFGGGNSRVFINNY